MSTEGHHRVRASDPEREDYVTILRAAMSEGRLTLEEGEERIARAYAVTYRDELPPTTDDLPGGGRSALHEAPRAQADQRRDARRFVAGRFAFAGVIAAFLTVGALSHGHFPWLLIPLFFVLFTLNRRRRFRQWAATSGGWGPGGWDRHHGHAGWGPGARGHRGWGPPDHGDGGPQYGGPQFGRPPWTDGPAGAGAGRHGGRPDDREGWGR